MEVLCFKTDHNKPELPHKYVLHYFENKGKDLFFHWILCLKVEITCNLNFKKNEIKDT